MPEKVTKAVLVNNAGSLGPISKTIDQLGVAEIRAYLDFNVVSTFALTYEPCFPPETPALQFGQ